MLPPNPYQSPEEPRSDETLPETLEPALENGGNGWLGLVRLLIGLTASGFSGFIVFAVIAASYDAYFHPGDLDSVDFVGVAVGIAAFAVVNVVGLVLSLLWAAKS